MEAFRTIIVVSFLGCELQNPLTPNQVEARSGTEAEAPGELFRHSDARPQPRAISEALWEPAWGPTLILTPNQVANLESELPGLGEDANGPPLTCFHSAKMQGCLQGTRARTRLQGYSQEETDTEGQPVPHELSSPPQFKLHRESRRPAQPGSHLPESIGRGCPGRVHSQTRPPGGPPSWGDGSLGWGRGCTPSVCFYKWSLPLWSWRLGFRKGWGSIEKAISEGRRGRLERP